MSANVKQFVVHQISLSEEGKLNFIPRATTFELTAPIIELAAKLHVAFNSKPSKGVGAFTDGAGGAFKDALNQLLQDESQFYDFSLDSCKMLLESIVSEGMVETGYVIFSWYEYLATDYLMIAMLDTKDHVVVNQALDLSQNKILDLSKLQLAVRIDITQLQTTPEDERYISFIKGRMGRKISDFFMKFLACEEKVDTKQQNKQFVAHLDNYLSSQSLDSNEKHEQRDIVSGYYKEKAATGEPIQVAELSDMLPQSSDHSSNSFLDYNASLEHPLESAFQADKTMISSMQKFSGTGGGVSLSFERKLLGTRIHYNPETDTISINGLPPNLKDQLLKNQGDDTQ